MIIILAFGWFFSGSSHANEDPLVVAYEEIQQLNIDINNLTYKNATQELIDIAEQKYDEAIEAKENKDDASENYDSAISTESNALEELQLAQSAVEGQTVTVDMALTHKNNAEQEKDDAQEALDIANINVQTAQASMQSSANQGWQFTAYYMTRGWPNTAVTAGQYCTGVLTQSYQGMPVCGRFENLIVVYSGKITAPEGVNQVTFRGFTDDGFRMYVDGQLVIQQWIDQGSTWSPPYTHNFTAEDRVIDVVFHYFNGGGPGVFHVGWGHSGIWTGVPSSAMSYGEGATQQQIDAFNEAVSTRNQAQVNYNNKLEVYNDKSFVYNQEVAVLNSYNQTLIIKNNNYSSAVINTANALQNKESSSDIYDQAIIDLQSAILDARNEYEARFDFEEKQRVAAAIAQALANQPAPQPTPEPQPSPTEQIEPSPEPEPTIKPSQEPTLEPTPEPTKPNEPSPSPKPEITDEPTPEPTPEPSAEPSPQPTEIDPEPTPEPEPIPSEVSSPDNDNIKTLIPEKGEGTSEDLSRVIANLTSKDNITAKLTPEQMAAVSQTLSSLSVEAKVEVAQSLGVKTDDIALLAEAAKDNPAVAAAIVSFNEKAEANADAPMPYTIADAITEAAAELFLQDPLAVFSGVDLEELSDPSQWGKDMTDDQREKAQEVIVPVILVSNIIASVASVIRRI